MQTYKWLLGLSVAVLATNVYALPEVSPTAAPDGANIHPVAPNATHMHIEQTAANAVVNWHSFNVGTNESVHFQQPSASSIILNRVDPRQGVSTIAGQISANGRVIISNGAGIHFTPTSRVDVAGLIATTANISNENFKKGKYIFEDSTNLSGKILNEGIISINAKEHGFAALIAPNVANKGVITASLGKIAMYSTTKFVMNFSGNDLIHFEVPDRVAREVVMRGDIIANVVTFNHEHAHEVLDHAIHVPDNTIARSVHERNGVIVLSAQPGTDLHASESNGTVTVAPRRAATPTPQTTISSLYLIENYADIVHNHPVSPLQFPADDGRLSGESGYYIVEDEKNIQPTLTAERLASLSPADAEWKWDNESFISGGHHSIDLSDVSDAKSEMSNDSTDYPALTAELLAQHNQSYETRALESPLSYVWVSNNDYDVVSLPDSVVSGSSVNDSDSSSLLNALSFGLGNGDAASFLGSLSSGSSTSSGSLSSGSSASEEVPALHLAFRFNSAGSSVIIPNDLESDLHLAFRFDRNLGRDIIPIDNEPNVRMSFRFNEIPQSQVVDMNAPVIVQPPGGPAVTNDLNNPEHDLHLAFRFNNDGAQNIPPNFMFAGNDGIVILQPPVNAVVPNDINNNDGDLHLAYRFADGPNLHLNFRFANNDEPNPEPNPNPVPVVPLDFRFNNNPEPDVHYVFFDPLDNAPVAEAPVHNAKVINAPQPAKTPLGLKQPVLTDNATLPNKLYIQCAVKVKYINDAQGHEVRCEEDFDLMAVKDSSDLITYKDDTNEKNI